MSKTRKRLLVMVPLCLVLLFAAGVFVDCEFEGVGWLFAQSDSIL
jgi:hypothetical protein